MKRSVGNLIFAALMGSAVFVAGLSSSANGKSFDQNFCEISTENQTAISFSATNNGNKHNSDFWSKFRDSVMPDDKNPPPSEPAPKPPPKPHKNN